MSGATKEIGAPENRIDEFQRNFVLTPRYEDLKPDTWTRSSPLTNTLRHNDRGSQQAIYLVTTVNSPRVYPPRSAAGPPSGTDPGFQKNNQWRDLKILQRDPQCVATAAR